jgi:hypothetical protein
MRAAATGQAKLAKTACAVMRALTLAHQGTLDIVTSARLDSCAPSWQCHFGWGRGLLFAGSALSGTRRTVPKGTDGDT